MSDTGKRSLDTAAPRSSSASSQKSPAHDDGVAAPRAKLNRIVWMLWFTGFENAPEVVQKCLRSWKLRNPTWQVVELTDENLPDYIDAESLATLTSLDIERQKLANHIRMYLISRHGGVWVDSTCFCCQPLDNWLHDYMASGFFAFRDPGPDRILANWFLAAEKGNPLASIFYEKHKEFFLRNKFPLQQTKRGRERVKRLRSTLNRNSKRAQLWTYPLIIKVLKVYPYFIFHYLFARTVRQNAICRDIWNKTPSLSARIPLKMNRAGVLSPMPDRLLDDLNQLRDPLYKVTYKYRQDYFTEGCILDHIMRSID